MEYVEWLEDRIDDARHDLATSDLHGRHEGDRTPLRDSSADTTTVRRQIATHYDVAPETVF